MDKHTPGPWKVSKDHTGDMAEVVAGGITVCYMGQAAIRRSDVVAAREANARLIAAAPALLEALESTISTLDTCDVPEMANEGDTVFWLERQRSAVDKARAAIALAKGESR